MLNNNIMTNIIIYVTNDLVLTTLQPSMNRLRSVIYNTVRSNEIHELQRELWLLYILGQAKLFLNKSHRICHFIT